MTYGVNLIFGWIWILLGFLTGAMLGMGFEKEGWLGGYSSLRRRMYRLGHISLFMLGLLNLLFAFTAHTLGREGPALGLTSILFMTGAATMPICCGIMAHQPRLKMIFAVPVVSLITGAGALLFALLRP